MVFWIISFIVYSIVCWVKYLIQPVSAKLTDNIKEGLLNYVFIVFYFTFLECSLFTGLQLQNHYFKDFLSIFGWIVLIAYLGASFAVISQIISILNKED